MSSTSEQSVVERVQSFVSENRRAVLVGAALTVAAIGGVAYYASTSRRPEEDTEKGERKKDKKKSKSKKKKTVKDKDGPILEERTPKVEEEDVVLTVEQITEMSPEERSTAAGSLKARGNTAYQHKQFAEAATLYSRAIAVSPTREPVFYSNRAACYVNMNPPQHDKVVEDCDTALELDKRYVKALNRRGTALEALDKYEDSLRDFTASTILEKFQNSTSAAAVERVLKKLAAQQANEILANRKPRLPSHMFISAYFGAFRERPVPDLPENPTPGDEHLITALNALKSLDYAKAFDEINEALAKDDISFTAGKAEALNLRGTFKFLTSDVPGAKEDLLKSVELLPSLTQSWVKIASVHMEQGDPPKAFECFEEAIKQNPNDPDIYYHRGQVLFIMNEFTQAAENYTKSTELDENFVFSHIQLAVAQYKLGNQGSSMATFRRTLRMFPDRSEPHNYYGELLLDQQRYEEAVEKFDKAIEIENGKPHTNVLPLVNKGLAMYQWKQDIQEAEKYCEEALRIDPECEAAVATLAQLNLQQSKMEKAVEMFEKQTSLARSEPELLNALTYQLATKAQIEFMNNYPEMAAELSSIARAMM